jgi:predicted ABC-type ATPase
MPVVVSAEASDPPCIWVLAGTNGAGKSSIAGAMLRESGGDYFNPDEVARALREGDPALSAGQANAAAWTLGIRQLDHAIRAGEDYYFETTLGGNTVPARLRQALEAGHEVRIWYVALASPELHIARVASRVKSGGHDIPEETIRRRYDDSRRNLVALLPRLTELQVYDNSREASPLQGQAPSPELLLHWRDGACIAPGDLRRTPEWAKPIVAQALKHRTSTSADQPAR